MMSYFDKRFEGIEKKLQQTNKNGKVEDTFKFKQKGNRIQFEFNQQILQLLLILLLLLLLLLLLIYLMLTTQNSFCKKQANKSQL